MYNPDMRLFKRGNLYQLEIRRNVRRSLKTGDIEEARKRAREIEREMLMGKILIMDRESSITLGEYCKQYEEWVNHNQAYNTYTRLTRILHKFRVAIGATKQLKAIKRRDLDTYVTYCRGLGNSPETINLEIRHIKAAMGKAVQWEMVKDNPFKNYKLIKHHKKPPQFLTVDEIRRVFHAIGVNRRYRLIFALYVYTGMRREEIYRLEWKHFRKNEIIIEKAKNYESRTIPITPALSAVLKAYPRGIGRVVDVTLDQIGRGMKYWLRQAGVGHVRPHDLRHTFASHLIMSGVDMRTVGDLLGHRSYQATLIYSHLLKEHKEKAIAKLPY